VVKYFIGGEEMPDFLTHMIFGKDVSASNIKEEKMFNLGLMGPDPFFYVTDNKQYVGFGHRLHDERNEEFMKKLCRTNSDFGLGFRLHFFLDDIFHPLINRICPDDKSHKTLERDLDAFFIREVWNKDHKNYRYDDYFPQALKDEFIVGINNAIKVSYSEELDFAKVFSCFRKNMKSLYDNYLFMMIMSYPIKFFSLGRMSYTHFYTFNAPSKEKIEKLGFIELWKKAHEQVHTVLNQGDEKCQESL